VHETFLAEAEAETEAFYPETEAFVNLSEAIPRPRRLSPRPRLSATEARPRPRLITRKCAFLNYSKLRKYLKCILLHGMELFVKLALNRYNIYIYLRLLCVQLSLSQQ